VPGFKKNFIRSFTRVFDVMILSNIYRFTSKNITLNKEFYKKKSYPRSKFGVSASLQQFKTET